MPQMPSLCEFSDRELECMPRCPYCRSGDSRDLFSENGFPYVQCVACSLIYLRIRVREECVNRIYDAPYHSSNSSRYARLIARKRLALLGAVPSGATIIEDGSGNGAFVAAAREAGYDARGCDLGRDAVLAAESLFGVELVQGKLQDLALEPGSVQVIASFNLLSHLYEPWSYMKQVARLLARGGQWICRTGNRAGVMAWVGRGQWSAPEHVFHFTLPLLQRMAHEAGLRWGFERPAFDSDFPYAFAGFARRGHGVQHRAAALATKVIVKGWGALGLPKEDIYFGAKRP